MIERGQRFGRLIVDHPLRPRADGNGPVPWLCRCDCGGVLIASADLLTSGQGLSCGCMQLEQEVVYAQCPSCGVKFEIVPSGKPTPQFCPSCATKYEGRAWRVCAICRKLFPAPPSATASTCSRRCYQAWCSRLHKGLPGRKWSESEKRRKAEQGRPEGLKLGTAAAQKSPLAGRFATNQEAKCWILIDPSGKEIPVRNLRMWAREHTELFGKPPGDKSANQIARGFMAIAQTLRGSRGTPGKQRGATSYLGWGLKQLPEYPAK